MSLVPYDSSSDSENETKPKTTTKKKVFIPPIEEFNSDDEDKRWPLKKSSLLELLPQPKPATILKQMIPNVVIRNERAKHAPSTQENINIAPEVKEPYCGLKNEHFRKIINSQKKKFTTPNVEIIKSITEPPSRVVTEIETPVNNTCKRKHHITYLAQQAKINEERFKQEWSQCKYKRQLTRLKYGF